MRSPRSSGYDRYRRCTALAVPCQVMAPSRTPGKPRDRSKTDHRDVRKLVRLFRSGDLTPIAIPDEAGRDLLRCRGDVQEDRWRWRHQRGKFRARQGRIYRDGRNWTRRHWTWLQVQRLALPVLTRTSQEYLFSVE